MVAVLTRAVLETDGGGPGGLLVFPSVPNSKEEHPLSTFITILIFLDNVYSLLDGEIFFGGHFGV